MKCLIIHANPNPRGFSYKVAETLKNKLIDEKQEVIVRDLYEIDFNPVYNILDSVENSRKSYSEDVREEHEYIQDADLIVFVYPVWWLGPPAMIKGYFDRVFTDGFAYNVVNNGLEKGLLGKKVAVINTMRIKKEYYENNGMLDAMKELLQSGIFEYTGLEPVGHKFFNSYTPLDSDKRLTVLEEVRAFAKELSMAGVDTKDLFW